jgi:hypothetical protein
VHTYTRQKQSRMTPSTQTSDAPEITLFGSDRADPRLGLGRRFRDVEVIGDVEGVLQKPTHRPLVPVGRCPRWLSSESKSQVR